MRLQAHEQSYCASSTLLGESFLFDPNLSFSPRISYSNPFCGPVTSMSVCKVRNEWFKVHEVQWALCNSIPVASGLLTFASLARQLSSALAKVLKSLSVGRPQIESWSVESDLGEPRAHTCIVGPIRHRTMDIGRKVRNEGFKVHEVQWGLCNSFPLMCGLLTFVSTSHFLARSPNIADS